MNWWEKLKHFFRQNQELQQALNQLKTDFQNLQQQLYTSERARTMEPLTTGLAHQIRQPLTIIRSSAQYILESFRDTLQNKDFEETLESIVLNIETLNEVINDILLFAKPYQLQMKKGSIIKLLQQSLRLLQHQIKEQKISVITYFPQDLPEIMMDEVLLLQAYLNLLINSLESLVTEGELFIKATYEEGEVISKVCIIIEDTGKGIPEEFSSKIFEPFFSTKEKGVGLGLSVSQGIVNAHGGSIHFEPRENCGSKVIMKFPVV
jgi:two-component system sensor histidine kinase AtoS